MPAIILGARPAAFFSDVTATQSVPHRRDRLAVSLVVREEAACR